MLRIFLYATLLIGNYTCTSQCSQRDACMFSKDQAIPTCYCDEKCPLYEDCCKEYILSKFQPNETASSETNTDSVQLPEPCVIISGQTDRRTERVGVFMIDKCFESGEKCLIEKDNFKRSLPVSFGDQVYVHADCAICNNINIFKVWSIVYELPNGADVVSFSQSGQSVNDDNILQLMQQGNISMKGYYLQPPEGLNPRYCFSEPPSSSNSDEGVKKGNGTFMQYQNIVSCQGIFFKNFEVCRLDGCCERHFSVCYELDLPFIGNSDSKGLAIGGLKILLQFDAHDNEELSKVRTAVPRISYMNQQVWILFKIRHTTTEFSDLDECIIGLIMYLKNSEFRLLPKYLGYRYGSVGNKSQIAYLTFWETALLSENELTKLLRLKMYFRIKLNPSGKRGEGELKTVYEQEIESSFTSINLQGQAKVSMLTQNDFRKPVSKMFQICKNVSLIVTRDNTGSRDLDAMCMEEDEQVHDSERSEAYVNKLTLLLILLQQCIHQMF